MWVRKTSSHHSVQRASQHGAERTMEEQPACPARSMPSVSAQKERIRPARSPPPLSTP